MLLHSARCVPSDRVVYELVVCLDVGHPAVCPFGEPGKLPESRGHLLNFLVVARGHPLGSSPRNAP
eukprot:2651653-Rhodomonas_salina.1